MIIIIAIIRIPAVQEEATAKIVIIKITNAAVFKYLSYLQ